MIIPLITVLKLIALGSIKLIFLLFGMAFFPIFALRFILGGATGMLMPTLAWLVENGRLENTRYEAIVQDLEELSGIELNRKEARQLLWQLITKMIDNMKSSLFNSVSWLRQSVRKLFG